MDLVQHIRRSSKFMYKYYYSEMPKIKQTKIKNGKRLGNNFKLIRIQNNRIYHKK